MHITRFILLTLLFLLSIDSKSHNLNCFWINQDSLLLWNNSSEYYVVGFNSETLNWTIPDSLYKSESFAEILSNAKLKSPEELLNSILYKKYNDEFINPETPDYLIDVIFKESIIDWFCTSSNNRFVPYNIEFKLEEDNTYISQSGSTFIEFLNTIGFINSRQFSELDNRSKSNLTKFIQLDRINDVQSFKQLENQSNLFFQTIKHLPIFYRDQDDNLIFLLVHNFINQSDYINYKKALISYEPTVLTNTRYVTPPINYFDLNHIVLYASILVFVWIVLFILIYLKKLPIPIKSWRFKNRDTSLEIMNRFLEIIRQEATIKANSYINEEFGDTLVEKYNTFSRENKEIKEYKDIQNFFKSNNDFDKKYASDFRNTGELGSNIGDLIDTIIKLKSELKDYHEIHRVFQSISYKSKLNDILSKSKSDSNNNKFENDTSISKYFDVLTLIANDYFQSQDLIQSCEGSKFYKSNFTQKKEDIDINSYNQFEIIDSIIQENQEYSIEAKSLQAILIKILDIDDTIIESINKLDDSQDGGFNFNTLSVYCFLLRSEFLILLNSLIANSNHIKKMISNLQNLANWNFKTEEQSIKLLTENDFNFSLLNETDEAILKDRINNKYNLNKTLINTISKAFDHYKGQSLRYTIPDDFLEYH